MRILITKNTDKPHTLLYRRDDGSVTWMSTGIFFIRHDLSHYVIEKTLGYTTAFMGMLNNGMDVRDFEDRTKRAAIPVTAEATYAENMANLFLMEIAQGEWEDFNKVVADSFVNMGKSFPVVQLSQGQLVSIRVLLRQLLDAWSELPAGQTMELNIELKQDPNQGIPRGFSNKK